MGRGGSNKKYISESASKLAKAQRRREKRKSVKDLTILASHYINQEEVVADIEEDTIIGGLKTFLLDVEDTIQLNLLTLSLIRPQQIIGN